MAVEFQWTPGLAPLVILQHAGAQLMHNQITSGNHKRSASKVPALQKYNYRCTLKALIK